MCPRWTTRQVSVCENPSTSQYFEVHPENPQPRLLKQAAALLARGGVLAVPTDSSYALVCQIDDKTAADSLRRIRRVDDKHHLTLLCRDLSELANYARVDNRQYRLLKLATPGPYTFILEASKEVPRRLSHPSRKTIGLRVPDHHTLLALLDLHGGPLLATTLIAPGEAEPLTGAHSSADAIKYADMCREFGLFASRGSDFHGPGESRRDLGSLPDLPGNLTPVWEHLQSRIH